MTINIPDPLHGELLRQIINSPLPKRAAIAPTLIYEKSILMITADPGIGKSSLSLQTALELSAGAPVFCALPVLRPYRVYYIQKERPKEEVLERIEVMQRNITWNPDNFWLDDELQRLDFSNQHHAAIAIDRIAKFKPEIVYIDPLYAGTKGISKDEIASAYCDFLTQLQKETGASIWINHHTTKESHDNQGRKIDRQYPFYGSQWLLAVITGFYYIEKTSEGTFWSLRKSNHSNLAKEFNVSYDPETHISSIPPAYGDAHDRLKLFCEHMKLQNKPFKFSEISTFLGVSHSHLRRLIETPPFCDILARRKVSGGPTLYTIKNL